MQLWQQIILLFLSVDGIFAELEINLTVGIQDEVTRFFILQ